jgi:DNA-binding beta-propeller fold protein YncE
MDFVALEPEHDRVWVPVGGTGSVDLFDIKTQTFSRVDGFPTAERERNGQKRIVGPSAVSIGDGTAFIGNRATSEVCPVETATLKPGPCIRLPSPTDCVAYVPGVKEVWVTTPRDQTIAVLDASNPMALKTKTTIHLDGAPEGYAVDPAGGVFLTNLEDKNETVVIDIASHGPKATWKLSCSAEGPRGVAVDGGSLAFVACTDRVLVLDRAHEGASLGVVETGAGVDNIDWVEGLRSLFVAAGKAATLTVAHVDPGGKVTSTSVPSVAGARNGVADGKGNAYVPDPMQARLLVFAGR